MDTQVVELLLKTTNIDLKSKGYMGICALRSTLWTLKTMRRWSYCLISQALMWTFIMEFLPCVFVFPLQLGFPKMCGKSREQDAVLGWLQLCACPASLFLRIYVPTQTLSLDSVSDQRRRKLPHGPGQIDPAATDLQGSLGLWQLPRRKRRWFTFWGGGARYSGGMSLKMLCTSSVVKVKKIFSSGSIICSTLLLANFEKSVDWSTSKANP